MVVCRIVPATNTRLALSDWDEDFHGIAAGPCGAQHHQSKGSRRWGQYRFLGQMA